MRPTIQNVSLATRLALVALLVTLMSLAVTASVGLSRGSDLADEIVDDRLVSLSSSRAGAVEFYVNSVKRELAALAASPSTAASIIELRDALYELDAEQTSSVTAGRVTDFYLSVVAPALEAVRGDGNAGIAALIPAGAAALSLQDSFTVEQETDDGTVISPELIVDPGDGSTYAELHRDAHRTWSGVVQQARVDDVLLIEQTTESVVYSYRKRIDFGTSLDLGPHSGSALARGVDLLSISPESGPLITPMSRYTPAFDDPTTFIISAVLDGNDVVGYIAYAISYNRFDEILAGPDPWTSFGESGEAFIADANATMITTTRSLEDDRVGFREASTQPGPGQLTDADRRRIAATGTTANVQQVPADANDAATTEPAIVDTINYSGDAVRSVTTRLSIDGVKWTLFVEAKTAELDATIKNYARDMLVAVALFVVAVTFVAVRWSHRLVAPVRALSQRLRRARSFAGNAPESLAGLRGSTPDSGGGVPPVTAGVQTDDQLPAVDPGPDEFVELGRTVDEMLMRLRERRAAAVERSGERTALLQQFLPAAIARRSEEADAEVLDHVRQASVAVIVLDGLGSMVGDDADQVVRDLLAELVDEIDAAAADAGVERVKLSGSTYYAVCGAGRPLLDHAPRTVAFALTVRDLVRDMSDGRLSARVGIAEGAVAVGLAERSAMIYDVWGDTVTLAEELSGAAPGGNVLVSDVIASHLSDDFVTAGDDGRGRSIITGHIGEGVTS